MRFLLLASTASASVVMYASQARVTGDIGNRAAATALCMPGRPARCNSIHAAISYTGDAVIDLLPADIGPLVGPTGVAVAATWADFWAGNIFPTLGEAGIVPGAVVFTGSTVGGGASEHNCREWTSADMIAGGKAGRRRWNGTRAIAGGRNHCWNAAHILCACNRRLATTLDLYSVPRHVFYPDAIPFTVDDVNALCSAAGPRSYPGIGVVTSSVCPNAAAMLCFFDFDMSTFLARNGYASDAMVNSDGSGNLQPWTTFMSDVFPTEVNALGCTDLGVVEYNCDNFTFVPGQQYETPDAELHDCADISYTTQLLCACPRPDDVNFETLAPTPPPLVDVVYVFGVQSPPSISELGDRITADALCGTGFEIPAYYGYESSPYLFSSCPILIALVCYQNDSVIDFPETRGFPRNAEVIFPYPFGGGPWPSWTAFMASGFDVINIGQGCSANGTFSGFNCDDFTDVEGTYTQPHEYEVTRTCNSAGAILCACAGLAGASSPDPTPEIIVYGVPVNGPVNAIGPRVIADSHCRLGYEFSNNYYNETAFVGCTNAAAIVCYPGGDDARSIPETHGLNRSARIIFPYGSPPIEFDGWDSFIDDGFFVGFGNSMGQGCNADGSYAVDANCNDFTTSDGYYALPDGNNGSCNNGNGGGYGPDDKRREGVVWASYAIGATSGYHPMWLYRPALSDLVS